MRKLLIILLLLTSFKIKSQTCLLVYDYMETYTWFGNWNTPSNTGFYINYFVSSNASAAMFGTGNGSSAIESAVYVLPNVTGLNATYAHKLSFRLGSYRISNSGAATAGVDGPDYVDVRYSTNNGVTATTEMRIAGNANAFWDYNTATAAKTANGVLTTYAPTAGGNRTATGDGYSVIELTIPAGATQLAFNLNCRVNSAGEEWWIDNAELIQLGPCAVLPIELVSFDGVNLSDDVYLNWTTASEFNSDYFEILRSIDAINYESVGKVDAGDFSTQNLNYTFIDYNLLPNIYYYKLNQVDYNGVYKMYGPVSINIEDKNINCLYKYYDIIGKEVDFDKALPGMYIRECNGKIEKVYK